MTEPVSCLELNSPDLDRSSAFFSTVFGWELRPFAAPDYLVASSNDPSSIDTGLMPSMDGGVERHFATMRRWLEDGVLLVGGPYLDDGGGGMVVSRHPTLEAAVIAANADPAVQAGLLTALVRPWHPAMWQSALDAAMG